MEEKTEDVESFMICCILGIAILMISGSPCASPACEAKVFIQGERSERGGGRYSHLQSLIQPLQLLQRTTGITKTRNRTVDLNTSSMQFERKMQIQWGMYCLVMLLSCSFSPASRLIWRSGVETILLNVAKTPGKYSTTELPSVNPKSAVGVGRGSRALGEVH